MNNHLQPHELRIGNWVNLFGERYDQVRCADFNMLHTELFSSIDYKHVFGIEITKEWLERLGAKHFYFEYYFNSLTIIKSKDGYYMIDIEGSFIGEPIFYIHQLQNLYFALTQTELKIKE